MAAYRVRIRDIVAPRSPTLFTGTALEASDWLLDHGIRAGEELFVEYHSKKNWQGDGWAPVRNDLGRMVAKEETV